MSVSDVAASTHVEGGTLSMLCWVVDSEGRRYYVTVYYDPNDDGVFQHVLGRVHAKIADDLA